MHETISSFQRPNVNSLFPPLRPTINPSQFQQPVSCWPRPSWKFPGYAVAVNWYLPARVHLKRVTAVWNSAPPVIFQSLFYLATWFHFLFSFLFFPKKKRRKSRPSGGHVHFPVGVWFFLSCEISILMPSTATHVDVRCYWHYMLCNADEEERGVRRFAKEVDVLLCSVWLIWTIGSFANV